MLIARVRTNRVSPTAKRVLYCSDPTMLSPDAADAMKPVMVWPLCVADVTASRISMKSERKLRIFQADAYLSIDLQQKLLTVVRRPAVIPDGAMPAVAVEERSFDPGDALLAEIESFLAAIAKGGRPVVTGEDGLRALETATRIAELVGWRLY